LELLLDLRDLESSVKETYGFLLILPFFFVSNYALKEEEGSKGIGPKG
jgi:hypothetical protein